MALRIVAALLLVALLALQYRLWLSPNGMRDLWRTESAIDAQTEENARLAERNRTLAAEVRDLKEGRAAIEERARTDLGMVGATRLSSKSCRRLRPAMPRRRRKRVPRRPGSDAAGRAAVRDRAGGGPRRALRRRRRPKQYVALLGRPVLSWSLGALLAVRSVRAVIVALSEGDRRFARLSEARDPRVRTCRGGARRELSVANALEARGHGGPPERAVLQLDVGLDGRVAARIDDLAARMSTMRIRRTTPGRAGT